VPSLPSIQSDSKSKDLTPSLTPSLGPQAPCNKRFPVLFSEVDVDKRCQEIKARPQSPPAGLVAVPLPFAQIHSFKTILQQVELHSVEKVPAATKPSLIHINRLLRTLETLDDDLHHCKDLTFDGSSTQTGQR
jgi:hypothetical protein